MRKRALAAAFVALLPSAAFAIGAKQVPVAKGEEVWFAEDHTLPMVAMVAAFPAGSVYDPKGKDGLASFAASLMNEGAGTLDSKAFQAALADKAIQFSVQTDRDWTVVSLVTLTANAKTAFRLLGLALAHPRFDAEAIARVRAQMLQNLKQEQEDPSQIAARDFHLVFFGPHPYAHDTDGDGPGLTSINRNDLVNFAAGHWVREGVKIAVAGDVNTATLTALVKSAFAGLRATAVPPPPNPTRLGAPGLHEFKMDVPQPNAVFALPGLLRSNPDYLAAYVANYILGGGGFSSRLTNEVREKRGLTYDISTDVPALRKAGLIEGAVATRADAMNQTLLAVRDTMAKFAASGPTQQELDDAKTYLTGSYPLSFSSNAGIAGQLNAFQRSGMQVDYVARRNSLIEAISLDDVKRVAKKYFNPKRMTVVVAGTMTGKKH
ncbi:MAG TPA: pitrilysin family protein [Rhizomicrobium sp.]|nr:pitrilysin family protein [Rhizomicrobium sp.]